MAVLTAEKEYYKTLYYGVSYLHFAKKTTEARLKLYY